MDEGVHGRGVFLGGQACHAAWTAAEPCSGEEVGGGGVVPALGGQGLEHDKS